MYVGKILRVTIKEMKMLFLQRGIALYIAKIFKLKKNGRTFVAYPGKVYIF